jgi:hypothetical protein
MLLPNSERSSDLLAFRFNFEFDLENMIWQHLLADMLSLHLISHFSSSFKYFFVRFLSVLGLLRKPKKLKSSAKSS